MKEKTTKKERNMKKVGLIVAATAGTIGTVGLGVMCYLKTKDCKKLMKINAELKLNKDIYKEAYEGMVFRMNETADDMELVKAVVGGPLIDRLIKNEELKLSRIETKIANLLSKNIDDNIKKVIEIKEADRKHILETIADFKDVKDALK